MQNFLLPYVYLEDCIYNLEMFLSLQGTEWKGVRSTLTPAFSSLQLRKMLPLVDMCTNQMVEFLRNYGIDMIVLL